MEMTKKATYLPYIGIANMAIVQPPRDHVHGMVKCHQTDTRPFVILNEREIFEGMQPPKMDNATSVGNKRQP